jgi:hypothetical protein
MRELPCGTLGAETGRSSAWSERRVWDAEVAGSDPAAPTRTDRLTTVPLFSMPFCVQCGQENPGVAKFCLACGAPIVVVAEAPAVVAEERKLITAVFCHLVGSTARSESLDVEDVKALVAPYLLGVANNPNRLFKTADSEGVYAQAGRAAHLSSRSAARRNSTRPST